MYYLVLCIMYYYVLLCISYCKYTLNIFYCKYIILKEKKVFVLLQIKVTLQKSPHVSYPTTAPPAVEPLH